MFCLPQERGWICFSPSFLASLEPLFSVGRGEREQHFSRRKEKRLLPADEQGGGESVVGAAGILPGCSPTFESWAAAVSEGLFCIQTLLKLILVPGISNHCSQWLLILCFWEGCTSFCYWHYVLGTWQLISWQTRQCLEMLLVWVFVHVFVLHY